MKIISNTAISIDGKIGFKIDQLVFLGTRRDRIRMSEIRGTADAILVGGQGFRNWPKPLLAREEDEKHDLKKKPKLNVVLSHSLHLPVDNEYLAEKRKRTLVLTDATAIPHGFPFEVVQCRGQISAEWIADEIAKRGVETLLIEGGSTILHMFLQSELIDEMFITLCPLIIGGHQAPSLVGGEGFTVSHFKRFEIVKNEVIGHEIFLHYKLLKNKLLT
ncbi:MAG: dihydrofolate reductase family protein [Deltaproteobacteria bacterium]|nr:dihydrofolate reductase family protein [Deltaproteobacteria bacterium]